MYYLSYDFFVYITSANLELKFNKTKEFYKIKSYLKTKIQMKYQTSIEKNLKINTK